MAYLLQLDALAIQALRRQRVFRDCADLFAETDEWLLEPNVKATVLEHGGLLLCVTALLFKQMHWRNPFIRRNSMLARNVGGRKHTITTGYYMQKFGDL